MKRMKNTSRWAEEWYMALPLRIKCLYDYIYDNADNVGVWAPNWRLATFQIGEEVYEKDVINKLSTKIEKLPCGKFFIKDFCAEVWGTLKPNRSRPHQAYVKLLEEYGLLERVSIDYSYPSEKKSKGMHRVSIPLNTNTNINTSTNTEGKGVQGGNQPVSDGSEASAMAARPTPSMTGNQLPIEYETWTQLILEDNDPIFDQQKASEFARVPQAQLHEIVSDHLLMLSRYPNMRPQSQKDFRSSVVRHLREKLKARASPIVRHSLGEGGNTPSAEKLANKTYSTKL